MRLAIIAFAFGLATLAWAQPAAAGPDLTVEVYGRSDRLGGDVYGAGQSVHMTIRAINRAAASAAAPGTISAGSAGYMIDVVLSTDRTAPPGFAIYAPSWREDVLLRGGRISRTPDLAPGASHLFKGPTEMLGSPPAPYEYLKFPLPTGVRPGAYFVCVIVDPAGVVAEDNEADNTACHPIRVRPRIPARTPPPSGV